MIWQRDLLGLMVGFVITVLTAPVGISGAVFLLPVQLDLLGVPNSQVTPTNLVFNVVAVPGALARYRRQGQLMGPLTRLLLLLGTVPGVILGVIIRVQVLPGPRVFRLFAAAVLLPIGLYVLTRRNDSFRQTGRDLSHRQIVIVSLVVGVIGGIYGIGGGSLLGPILIGSGLPLAIVAPAALASTFVTSLAGILAYAVISFTQGGSIGTDWELGVACGLGGLLGSYAGARLQPWFPERVLRCLLGILAIGLSLTYILWV